MAIAMKFNSHGDRLDEVVLPDCIFEVDVDSPNALLHQVVTMYQANQRQGTVQKKSRSMTAGSTHKLFKQKGTGNARVGTKRTCVRVHGGKAFAIFPKGWYRKIPKGMKRRALQVALTDRARDGRIFIVDQLQFDQPNTKQAIDLLNKIVPERGRKLVVTEGHHKPTVKSFSNIPDVITDRADGLYAYEILSSSYIILTGNALKKIEEVFGS